MTQPPSPPCDLPCQNLPIILRDYSVSSSVPGTQIVYTVLSLYGNQLSSLPGRTWNIILKASIPTGTDKTVFTFDLSNVQSQGYNVVFADTLDGTLTIGKSPVYNARRYMSYDVINRGTQRFLVINLDVPSCRKNKKQKIYFNINISDSISCELPDDTGSCTSTCSVCISNGNGDGTFYVQTTITPTYLTTLVFQMIIPPTASSTVAYYILTGYDVSTSQAGIGWTTQTPYFASYLFSVDPSSQTITSLYSFGYESPTIVVPSTSTWTYTQPTVVNGFIGTLNPSNPSITVSYVSSQSCLEG